MGPNAELHSVAQAIIESIQSAPDNWQEFQCMSIDLPKVCNIVLIPLKKVSDDILSKLAFIFPENLILAALDLIDRENG
jgi:hypothetical protein